MDELHSLLDGGYFVQLRREEGRQEGVALGREEGLKQGLQEAVIAMVEVRFPALLALAQVRVRQARHLKRCASHSKESKWFPMRRQFA